MDNRKIKNQLRRQALHKRDGLDVTLRNEMSHLACEHGKKNLQIVAGTIVSGFFPIRSEIDPGALMEALEKKEVRLCLPVVSDRTTIIFRQWISGAAMVDTGFGTKGPDENAKIVDPDLMLVPLAAYDGKGNRIGYGAGHYDRAITKLKQKGKTPKLIGMAFSLQQVDAIPAEAHDQRLNGMITETGFEIFNTKEEA